MPHLGHGKVCHLAVPAADVEASARDGKASAFATVPPSVAAFHLAIGPDGAVYVTAPTLVWILDRRPPMRVMTSYVIVSAASAHS